jgi:hypothetical protein
MKSVFVVCFLKEDAGIEYFNIMRVFSNEKAAAAYCDEQNAKTEPGYRYPFFYEQWDLRDE